MALVKGAKKNWNLLKNWQCGNKNLLQVNSERNTNKTRIKLPSCCVLKKLTGWREQLVLGNASRPVIVYDVAATGITYRGNSYSMQLLLMGMKAGANGVVGIAGA